MKNLQRIKDERDLYKILLKLILDMFLGEICKDIGVGRWCVGEHRVLLIIKSLNANENSI